MYKGIYLGVSGTILADQRVSALSNNLANQSTIGFKRDRTSFRSYLLNEEMAGSQPSPSLYPASKVMVSFGSVQTDLTPGEISTTGNPLDLAINGDGFFEIQTPAGVRYSRKGTFTLDSERNVITPEGYALLADGGPLTLPDGGAIVIEADGTVSVDGQTAGRVQIMGLDNPVKGADGLFTGTPSPSENAQVVQGAVEQSNVEAFREMVHLIQTVREYEANMRIIQAYDTTSAKTVTDLGRV